MRSPSGRYLLPYSALALRADVSPGASSSSGRAPPSARPSADEVIVIDDDDYGDGGRLREEAAASQAASQAHTVMEQILAGLAPGESAALMAGLDFQPVSNL